MKFQVNKLPNGRYTTLETLKSVGLVTFTLFSITLPLFLMRNSFQSSPSAKIYATTSTSLNLKNSTTEDIKRCHIFSGRWVPYTEGPYYNNETCYLIIDQSNCLKFGRPDREFLQWRWKPEECDLPLFEATQFLELVRGKSMAFVGDSLGRNQMLSLSCLLSHVSYPEDVSLRYTQYHTKFKQFFYANYNFTLATLWSPFLVRASDDHNGIPKLYLDEADEAWASEVEKFDFVIISAGQWFFRPLQFYENGQLVGCSQCGQKNITDLTIYYGYRRAFRTAFRTIVNLKGYKGVTFFRTFSPAHFENWEWNKGGSCVRTKPFTKEEMRLSGYILETYLNQVEEFREAEKEARKRGLKFLMLNTTGIMLLRPDGHPNSYGHPPELTYNDCVHWCLPGPIDTWNEFLLYMLKMEIQASSSS